MSSILMLPLFIFNFDGDEYEECKKLQSIIFVSATLLMLHAPYMLSSKGGEVSSAENRTLSSKPNVFTDKQFGTLNLEYGSSYDKWFKYNMGLRSLLIQMKAELNYYAFNKLNQTDVFIGNDGNLVYGNDFLLEDYMHLDLRTADDIQKISDSYSVVKKMVE